MTPRDAARAACVSRAFRCSWRFYPNLIFNVHTVSQPRKVDRILKKHSCIDVKTFELDFSSCYKPEAYEYLHKWLQKVVTPGIEKLTLVMPEDEAVNFPCSVLSNGNGSSIWYLHLVDCAFHPKVGLGCLGNLKVLHLERVRITGAELGRLLPSCVALEQLKLRRCYQITYLKIPSRLQRLSSLQVLECHRLKTIENKAPNINSFCFIGNRVEFLFGESLRLKNAEVLRHLFLRYALEELPSIAPNLETLIICSWSEVVNTTLTLSPCKFLYLKYLSIYISGSCDCLSLVYFLDAAPSLETFKLRVLKQLQSIDELLSEDSSHLRQIPGYRHDKLRRVNICRFPSSKSMVELTSHILENSASLECLTLDTTDGNFRCSDDRSAKCSCLNRPMEARKAALIIERYIKGKVPSTLQLDVVDPCSRCHDVEL
uniref:At1g61320/AtMIF1 LRR domain-containing protein n=1 Tax=Triticum urartu TaxID=4572 RepID=A0A8R7UKG8_TRIUA